MWVLTNLPSSPCLTSFHRERKEKGLLRFACATFMIVRHLETCSPEATLHVETFVRIAAIEDALIAANLLGDVVERLDEPQAEFFALLVFCHGYVLDVANLAQAVDAVVGARSAHGSKYKAEIRLTICAQLSGSLWRQPGALSGMYPRRS